MERKQKQFPGGTQRFQYLVTSITWRPRVFLPGGIAVTSLRGVVSLLAVASCRTMFLTAILVTRDAIFITCYLSSIGPVTAFAMKPRLIAGKIQYSGDGKQPPARRERPPCRPTLPVVHWPPLRAVWLPLFTEWALCLHWIFGSVL